MKICSTCHQEKDETEFYKNKKVKDGLYSNCKTCHKECVTSWIKKNPDKHNFYCSKTPSTRLKLHKEPKTKEQIFKEILSRAKEVA